jgi:hypothetical protein
LQLVRIAPSAPEAPDSDSQEPVLVPQRRLMLSLVLLPEAALTFGNGLFATAEVGLAAQLRIKTFALGLHMAKGPSMADFNDDQSCMESFCAEKRARIGLNVEYAFVVLRFGQVWAGVDVESLTATGYYWVNGGTERRTEERNGMYFTSKVGFEAAKRWSPGLVGGGPFMGLTYGGVRDADGFGVTVGVRGALGI